jgi:hypothetical protein
MTTYAKEYENYIISGFREENLSTLVPGSDAEKYINIFRKVNSMESLDKQGLENVRIIIKIFFFTHFIIFFIFCFF